MAGAAVEGFDHSRSCHRGHYRDRCLAPPQRMKIMNIVWPSAGDCRRDRHPLGPDGRVKERGQDPARAGRTHEQGLVQLDRLNIITEKPRKGNGEPQFSQSFAAAPRPFAGALLCKHQAASDGEAATGEGGPRRVRAEGRLEASPRRRRRSQARMRPSLPPW